MRHPLIAAATLIGALIVALGHDLLACGEKYYAPARGTRFDRPPARREEASVLLYANPGSELSRVLTRQSVARALQKVGYRPTLAESAPEFESALNRQRWDVVVADVALISGRQAVNASAVVPVSYGLSGAQWKEARRQYPSIVKSPGTPRTFLEAIDLVLEHRAAGGSAGSGK